MQRLADDHPAVVTGRTRYLGRVEHPSPEASVLKSGQNNPKIGRRVVGGPWSGMPIFTLTLEERATCWSECRHWHDCYGNKMHWPARWTHGLELEAKLDAELAALNDKHPEGFVVRLHVLGDFYSVAYVEKWKDWLTRYPALRVFGYTAYPPDHEIGHAVAALRESGWDRFAVRTSNAGLAKMGETTINRKPEGDRVPEGIVCPAQTGKKECCATCGLCWQTTENIAFILH